MNKLYRQQDISDENLIFAMDIGTRSIIGMVGVMDGDKLHILAVEKEEHAKRAMIDGQIEDIQQVANVGQIVKERLENKLGRKLTRVCVAAAGRALKTQKASFELQLPEPERVDAELISRLEGGAIGEAEAEFVSGLDGKNRGKFYLVGHTVVEYQLDGYPMSNLLGHQGKKLRAEVIATFLPGEVVESLYTTMHQIDLDVISMTLEPIAAINAVIPANLRLLNLALVDIGAGTSDIAVSRDGGVVGYTMATVAGDEITEALMKSYLLDFSTAEHIKAALGTNEEIRFTDILGIEQTLNQTDLNMAVSAARDGLCREIAERVVEVNGGTPPSAIFLAGGGSKLNGMRETVADYLGMDLGRVAIAGNNFEKSAVSDECSLNDPEYATPLGIVISAGFNLISDSFHVTLNGKRAKLFQNGSLTVQDILMMNGYSYQEFMPRSGKNLMIQLNGRRAVFRGEPGEPAMLTLNGEEVRLSTLIHAGDEIEFQPAMNGAPAHITLGELLRGSHLMATINGVLGSPEDQLKNGDVIEADLESILPKPQEAPKMEPDVPPVTKMMPVAQETTDQEPEILKLEPKKEVEEPTPPTGLAITLNDAPLILPEKPEEEPYYLMNLLEYSGISLDNPGAEVVLHINGRDGSFLDEINPGDVVDIYCKRKA